MELKLLLPPEKMPKELGYKKDENDEGYLVADGYGGWIKVDNFGDACNISSAQILEHEATQMGELPPCLGYRLVHVASVCEKYGMVDIPKYFRDVAKRKWGIE